MAKLYFYYSAMNAGKSTALLQSNHNYHERGMNTLLFSPAYGIHFGKVTSRIGLENDAEPFDNDFNFDNFLSRQQQPIHCILVDEAQFLSKIQVAQLASIASEKNIPVLTYGIRTDFRGEPFPGSTYLLAWAEKLVELKTICHCGKKATMNLRIDDAGNVVREGKQVEIGGNERYISVCQKHFHAGKIQS